MGVYANVDGVIRKVSRLCPEVSGAVRTGKYGFCDVYGARRQYYGPLEDVTAVEIRVDYGYHYDLDASGETTNGSYFYTASDANRYGSVSISGNSISITTETLGKMTYLSASAYALFADGREVDLSYLSAYYAQYGAAISWPVTATTWFVDLDSGGGGQGWNNFSCCGNKLPMGGMTGGGTKTLTLTSLSEKKVWIGAGRGPTLYHSYYGSRMQFGAISIDGRNVPVRVISELA